jgi:hypothetical protein
MNKFLAAACVVAVGVSQSSCGGKKGPAPFNTGEDDFCSNHPNCDVQGTPVNLLHAESSRVLVTKPEEFIGAVYDAEQRDGIYTTRKSCGAMDPSWLEVRADWGGTITVDDKSRRDIKAGISTRLKAYVSGTLAAEVDKVVSKTTVATVTYRTVVHSLKEEHSKQRKEDCRIALCGPVGETCADYLDYALISSAAVVALSGSGTTTTLDELKAGVEANADLKAGIASAAAEANASIENVLSHAVEESLTTYQFAAYLGWSDTLRDTMVPPP